MKKFHRAIVDRLDRADHTGILEMVFFGIVGQVPVVVTVLLGLAFNLGWNAAGAAFRFWGPLTCFGVTMVGGYMVTVLITLKRGNDVLMLILFITGVIYNGLLTQWGQAGPIEIYQYIGCHLIVVGLILGIIAAVPLFQTKGVPLMRRILLQAGILQ